MVYEIKTKNNEFDEKDFIKKNISKDREKDFLTLYNIFKKVFCEKGFLFGENIIGFKKYNYKTKSGCFGEWFKFGFSFKKNHISIYLLCDISKFNHLLEKIGKIKKGKGCINFSKLKNIDLKILEKILKLD